MSVYRIDKSVYRFFYRIVLNVKTKKEKRFLFLYVKI